MRTTCDSGCIPFGGPEPCHSLLCDQRTEDMARDRRAAWVAFVNGGVASLPFQMGEGDEGWHVAIAQDADLLLAEYDARVKDGRL